MGRVEVEEAMIVVLSIALHLNELTLRTHPAKSC